VVDGSNSHCDVLGLTPALRCRPIDWLPGCLLACGRVCGVEGGKGSLDDGYCWPAEEAICLRCDL